MWNLWLFTTGMTTGVSIILVLAESCLDYQMTVAELIVTVTTWNQESLSNNKITKKPRQDISKKIPFLRFTNHTQWHATAGKTPLKEGSACHRALYLTAYGTDVNAPGSIPPHSPTTRLAIDPYLRQISCWDRHIMYTVFTAYKVNGVCSPSSMDGIHSKPEQDCNARHENTEV
jgi:hypothetical protein